MSEEEFLRLIEAQHAILKGHFVLAQGNHADRYVVKDLVVRSPEVLDRFAEAIARHFANFDTTLVVGPSTGGIALASAVARFLPGLPDWIYCERSEQGMDFGRGFPDVVTPKMRTLVVEDISTSGKTTDQVLEACSRIGVTPVGIGVMWIRGAGVEFDLPTYTCVQKVLPSWSPDECPLCEQKEVVSVNVGHGGAWIKNHPEATWAVGVQN